LSDLAKYSLTVTAELLVMTAIGCEVISFIITFFNKVLESIIAYQ